MKEIVLLFYGWLNKTPDMEYFKSKIPEQYDSYIMYYDSFKSDYSKIILTCYDQYEKILENYNIIHVISFSLGGLISTKVISLDDKKVKTIVTIGTPWKGTPVEDAIIAKPIIGTVLKLKSGSVSDRYKILQEAIKASHQLNNKINVGCIAGNNSQSYSSGNKIWAKIKPGIEVFNGLPNDTVVDVTSALAFPNKKLLKDYLVVDNTHYELIRSERIVKYCINFIKKCKFN